VVGDVPLDGPLSKCRVLLTQPNFRFVARLSYSTLNAQLKESNIGTVMPASHRKRLTLNVDR